MSSKFDPPPRGGVELAGRTVDWTIRVLYPAYPHPYGKEVKDVFGRPGARLGGRLDTLKITSCPWRWVPGSRSKF